MPDPRYITSKIWRANFGAQLCHRNFRQYILIYIFKKYLSQIGQRIQLRLFNIHIYTINLLFRSIKFSEEDTAKVNRYYNCNKRQELNKEFSKLTIRNEKQHALNEANKVKQRFKL